MSLQLRRFDPSKIRFNHNNSVNSYTQAPTIVIIGRRETGKSYLIKDLISHFSDVPVCNAISGTGDKFYSQFLPKCFIHEEYDPEIIGKVLLRQKKLARQIQQEKETNKCSTTDARIIVALDDCLYDDKWTRDKLMRCLFLDGRSWQVMLMVSLQYPLGIPPLMRSNIDYVFIMREGADKCRRLIYENYASVFPSYESFCAVMDQTTNDYECLVIANHIGSNKLADCVFWYKAEEHPNLKLCKQEYWDIPEHCIRREKPRLLTHKEELTKEAEEAEAAKQVATNSQPIDDIQNEVIHTGTHDDQPQNEVIHIDDDQPQTEVIHIENDQPPHKKQKKNTITITLPNNFSRITIEITK
jgi:hypothetical protein